MIFALLPPSFALTVTPVRQEIRVIPGGNTKGSYTVSNETKESLQIKVSAREWFKWKENKDIAMSDWLILSPKKFLLESGESKKVNYEVKIPTQAVGVLSAMLSFSPQTKSSEGVVLSVSLYAIVEGTEVISADIEKTDIQKKEKNLHISVTFKNRGNIHLRPEGEVIIIKKKKEIDRFKLRLGRPVYPGKTRTLVGDSKIGIISGKYRARILLYYGDNSLIEKVIPFKINRKGKLKVKE